MKVILKGGAVGFLAGFLSAVLGLGPGMVIISALNVFYHLEMKNSVACGLALVIPVTIFSAVSHIMLHDLQANWSWVAWIMCGGFFGILGGVFLRDRMPEKLLKFCFIIFLCFILVRFMGLISWGMSIGSPQIISHILLGVTACFMSAVTGVGGGVLVVSMYHGFYDVAMKECVLMGLAIMIFNSTLSSILKRRSLKWSAELWPIMVFSIPGGILGVVVYKYASTADLRRMFVILLSFIIFRMSQSLYQEIRLAIKK